MSPPLKRWGHVALPLSAKFVRSVLCLFVRSYRADGQTRDFYPIPGYCSNGSIDRPHCVLHIAGCEDIKTVAQLIEPKDDLVTVDHLFDTARPQE